MKCFKGGVCFSLLRLMRFDRFWVCLLLAFPFVWSMVLLTKPISWGLFVGGLIGCVVGRSLGCVWNDLCDREYDGLVRRTKSRPLASGRLSANWARVLVCLGFACGVFLIVLLQNARFTGFLAVLVLGIWVYPLCKRHTKYAQVVLGLVVNMGAFFPFCFVPCVSVKSLLFLYAGGVFWTTLYDTVYGLQDYEDDVRIGLKGLHIFVMQSQRFKRILYILAMMVALCMWARYAVFGERFSRLHLFSKWVVACLNDFLIEKQKPCVGSSFF